MYTYFLYSTGPEIEINFCQYCDVIVTKNAKALLVHSKTCTHAPRPDRSYNFVCYSCPYHTYKSDHMRDHIMTHTGERPYQCGQCNFRSSRKNSVIVHFRVKHSWRFWKKKSLVTLVYTHKLELHSVFQAITDSLTLLPFFLPPR